VNEIGYDGVVIPGYCDESSELAIVREIEPRELGGGQEGVKEKITEWSTIKQIGFKSERS
jgi:hypothetical protein